ncbi:MAG: peptidase domain-containing ABC transporter [Muribaculum sp.]|nr:peptidase domain-containing ABC transporter [Muribaculum sp.]
MKFTRQFDRMDCGPACVRMIASHFGRNFPLSYLRSLSQLTREGVSVAGIRHALSAIGIESASFEMTTGQLKEHCPMPAILYWEQRHFVVIERVTRKGGFVVCDPAYGRNRMSREEFERSWLNGEKGVAIAVEPSDGFYSQATTPNRHGFWDFTKKYILPFKSQLLQSFLAMLVGMLLGLVAPFLTQAVVDQGIATKNLGLIFDILLAQIALFVGQFIMNTIGSWVTLYMSTHISIGILRDYLAKLLRLPMSFFDTKSVGDYQQRLGDHSRLQSFMTGSSVGTLFLLFSVPFYLCVIAFYSPIILGVFLLFTALSTGWMSYFFRRRKSLDYEQFAISAQNQTKLYELISGITDIKVNGYSDYKLAEWESLQQKQYAMSRKSLRLNQIQNTGFTIINQLRNIIITCWIAAEVVNGSLTLGMMMSISAIIGMVSGSLGQLIGFLQQYQDAKISLERSQEVHLCEPEDNNMQTDVPGDSPKDIELHGVSFSYTGADGNMALSDVSFKIPAGKMTAIVGESGSGKTTLMKLLLKFYDPTKGRITLGGNPLSDYTAESMRRQSGIVMQENFLFSDSIRHNIIMGEPFDATRLQSAIKTACLEDLINRHPLGAEMKVGADGLGVSGGEQQRIMIARAAYKNPLYLMMDEATSSLDADNEARITANLAKNFANRTRIVIAHRLSTVRNADNIIVLRHGRVVEQGTHEQLVALGGYYLTLIQNQLELASK